MARSTARKRALNTLYEADEKGQDILSLLDERIAHPGAQTPLPDYAIQIVRGVAEHKRSIDATLDRHSTRWPLGRMHVIDRNLLRIAAWEMLYNPEVPDKVAIDEALSLAKSLSDSDAPSFIHGLLSAVQKEKDEESEHEESESVRRQEASRIADLALAEADKAEQEASQVGTEGTLGSEHQIDGLAGAGDDSEPGAATTEGEINGLQGEGVSLADLTLTMPDELYGESSGQ